MSSSRPASHGTGARRRQRMQEPLGTAMLGEATCSLPHPEGEGCTWYATMYLGEAMYHALCTLVVLHRCCCGPTAVYRAMRSTIRRSRCGRQARRTGPLALPSTSRIFPGRIARSFRLSVHILCCLASSYLGISTQPHLSPHHLLRLLHPSARVLAASAVFLAPSLQASTPALAATPH
ncbi:hypothetical protein T440DRAFT_50382 [Plenodomus tracheiphilus IPT5]|uniref:Uncharacterized protein n=1 Tax=Plenodomus tracheiphilus IPT5 TaxID=1408161 RepID=A0A6A7B9Z9_9PLEO|nr:hypothetical protein T440DRAFT_50382 [Plenodomus tracheiphilus IPT5]